MSRFLLRLALPFVFAVIAYTPRLSAQITPMCSSGCVQAVTVTPIASPVARIPSITDTAKYVVENQLGYGIEVTSLSCTRTSYVASCSVLTAPGMNLNDGQWDTVRVAYTTASSGTSGTVKLNVNHDGAGPKPVSGTLTVNYAAPTPPIVTLVVPRAQSGSRALVATRTPVVRALLMPNGSPVDSTRTTLKWRGTLVKNVRHNRGLLEWAVDSARGLALADSALVEVTACSMSNQCTTVTRWAVLLADSKPLLGMTAHALGIVGSGMVMDLGAGMSLNQAELETGFAIPSYTSMGIARSAGLTYSTRQSYPRALVPIDIELTWPVGTPDEVRLVLREGAVGLDSTIVATPTCSTGASRRCRGVLQADYASSTFPTPVRKWLTVEVRVTSGGTVKSNTDSVEVVLVDRRTTAYGSGWWPSGVLQSVAAGGDRLVVDSRGSATIYRGNGDSLYVPPPGLYTTLVKTANGWELRPRGSSATTRINATGQHVADRNPYGSADSVLYDGSGRVVTLKDPVGKTITFGYDANGKLATLTDPASRQSRITINNTTHQLTYDSLSSPAAKSVRSSWAYQTYPGSGTVVLTRRIGVLLDTTLVTYDSTFKRRPSQSRLPQVGNPAGGWINPVVQVQPMERRGLGGLISLDSAYAQATDPRGYWARALVTFGGPRLVWDALGIVARASYMADGQLLWMEGKTGDSSRVYYAYDSLARPIKSFTLRTASDTVRGDSLVYDGVDRLVRVIDPRGRIDSVQLNSQGSVLRSWDGGVKTEYWYRSNGLLDSIRQPLSTASTRISYDATFKNASEAYDALGNLMWLRHYDAAGRDTATDQKIRVLLTDTVSTWQWRRNRTTYDEANRRQTVALMRSNNCGVCGGPPGGSAGFVLTDTLKTRLITYSQDRGGRDSLRQNERGIKTEYLYDRLDRLVRRRPWTDSTAVQDSMVYDVAGNAIKIFTRRGHVITSDYDLRNRDTLIVIPTVGTIRTAYLGPLDQVTRRWVVSPVDPIGGVNGELRAGFDQRGRLRADTAYTGTQVRARTYTYDRFERDSTTTTPTGAFAVHWNATRPVPNALLTPYGDSLTFLFDARQRPTQLQALSATNPAYTRTQQWNSINGGTALITEINGYSPGKWLSQGIEVDDPPPAVGPTWYQSKGAGLAVDSFRTTTSYDGWMRLLTWKEVRPGGGSADSASASYAFDRIGNITTPGGGEVYDITTGRLLQQTEGGLTRTFTYDRAGNLVSSTRNGLTSTYGYNALNQLVSVEQGAILIARYGYDVAGRRIAKYVYSDITGGTIANTRYVMSGDHVAFETDAGGTVGTKYTWGLETDDLVGITSGSTQVYAVPDRLGSVRGIVRRDGTWLMNQRFDPYGQRIARDSSGALPSVPYGWTGREYDPETGWYYVRARYYSPKQRRFVQEDPIGYDGGTNLYSWVDGRALEATDPSGLDLVCVNRRRQVFYNYEIAAQAGGDGYVLEEIRGTARPVWVWEPGGCYDDGSSAGPRNVGEGGSGGATGAGSPQASAESPTCNILGGSGPRGQNCNAVNRVAFVGATGAAGLGRIGLTASAGLYCTPNGCGAYYTWGSIQGGALGLQLEGGAGNSSVFFGPASGGCVPYYCNIVAANGRVDWANFMGWSPLPISAYKFETTTGRIRMIGK